MAIYRRDGHESAALDIVAMVQRIKRSVLIASSARLYLLIATRLLPRLYNKTDDDWSGVLGPAPLLLIVHSTSFINKSGQLFFTRRPAPFFFLLFGPAR